MECPPIPVAPLRAAIAALTLEQQRVFILIAREGLGVEAVAETMQLSTRAVERLLAEAIAELLYILDQ